jgi:hypothetical protein
MHGRALCNRSISQRTIFQLLPADVVKFIAAWMFTVPDMIRIQRAFGHDETALMEALRLRINEYDVHLSPWCLCASAQWLAERGLHWSGAVVYCNFTPKDRITLAPMFTNLVRLTLIGNGQHWYPSVAMDAITACPNVTELVVDNITLTDEMLATIERHPTKLRSLCLVINTYVDLESVGDVLAAHDGSLAGLTVHCGIPERPSLFLQHVDMLFERCQHLTSLTLPRLCTAKPFGVVRSAAAAVARLLPNLTHLDLSDGLHYPSTDLFEISEHCAQLAYLDLSNSPSSQAYLGDAVVTVRKLFAHLTVLRLNYQRFLVPEMVATICETCPKLQFLQMDQCIGLTADLVRDLARHCPQLREVSCKHSGDIAVEAVARLQEDFPRLHVVTAEDDSPSEKLP